MTGIPATIDLLAEVGATEVGTWTLEQDPAFVIGDTTAVDITGLTQDSLTFINIVSGTAGCTEARAIFEIKITDTVHVTL